MADKFESGVCGVRADCPREARVLWPGKSLRIRILDIPNMAWAWSVMWQALEHRQVDKDLSSRVPVEILKRYEKWKDIAGLSGPVGLRAVRGFHDEALSGTWKGHRSSHLNEQWRVIYRVKAEVFLVQVLRVTPHDYRRR